MSPKIFHQYPLERILFGQDAGPALVGEVDGAGEQRVFLVTNRSLADRPELDAIRAQLGNRLAGQFTAARAHSPRRSVIEGARAAREAGADVLVAIGGGSVIDATKAMLLALRHDLTEPQQLDEYVGLKGIDPSRRPADEAQWIRMVAVPTTLSAAEFAWFAGITDEERAFKDVIGRPLMIPRAVILDPRLTLTVETEFFLATGIKAVDHAAERIAALNWHPYNDAMSGEALRLLTKALPRVKADSGDLEARADCQLAMWMSTAGKSVGVIPGASHAIGHVLGAYLGVPHGYTSCVMLPAVMRWNLPTNAHRQAAVSAAMGRPDIPADVALRDLIAGLGLPLRLRDVSVKRADFDFIAEKMVHDFVAPTNPRTIQGSSDVREILELAW